MAGAHAYTYRSNIGESTVTTHLSMRRTAVRSQITIAHTHTRTHAHLLTHTNIANAIAHNCIDMRFGCQLVHGFNPNCSSNHSTTKLVYLLMYWIYIFYIALYTAYICKCLCVCVFVTPVRVTGKWTPIPLSTSYICIEIQSDSISYRCNQWYIDYVLQGVSSGNILGKNLLWNYNYYFAKI